MITASKLRQYNENYFKECQKCEEDIAYYNSDITCDNLSQCLETSARDGLTSYTIPSDYILKPSTIDKLNSAGFITLDIQYRYFDAVADGVLPLTLKNIFKYWVNKWIFTSIITWGGRVTIPCSVKINRIHMKRDK